MKRLLCLFALLVSAPLLAGQLRGDTYVGERYGHIEIAPPPGQWDIQDQESPGDEPGGPVAELRLRQPIGGIIPMVRVTGIKKADASVTAEGILATSREALQQQGGLAETIQTRGRATWVYDGKLTTQGQPARMRLVLQDGGQAFFLLQMVVPAGAFDEAVRALDDLLPAIRY